jgi:host factor-I protein
MGEYGETSLIETPARMEKSAQNIQDSFLNNARKEKASVTIYLLGGVRLNGRIKSFDKYSLILESNSQEHLVFKHAISTVVTGRPSHPASHPPQPGPARVGDGTTAEVRHESTQE